MRNRLFDKYRELNECQINSFIEDISNVVSVDNVKSDNKIDAGYTYIGQLIAHDIVPSTRIHSDRKSINAYLDLKSIYGDGVTPAHFDKTGRFILGNARFSNGTEKLNEDLIRNTNGKALIPDRRNDENIIISQLHLFWQSFHNKIVFELEMLDGSVINHLDSARSIVIKIFHEIIRYDYLPKIIHHEVYSLYFKKGERFSFYYNDDHPITTVPIEFSHAAFRFGHSMVRNEYSLNTLHNRIETKDLFNSGLSNLPVDSIITWGKFFQVFDLLENDFNINEANFEFKSANPETHILPQQSKNIDTYIVDSMKSIPVGKDVFEDIRKINIEAGLKLEKPLLFGEDARCELESIDELKSLLGSELYQKEDLVKLPLWPYILKEAEIFQNNTQTIGLGPVGSIIVSEVMSAVLLLDYQLMNNCHYDVIIDKIKQKQYKIESSHSGINNLPNLQDFKKYPLKMGYCINFK